MFYDILVVRQDAGAKAQQLLSDTVSITHEIWGG
jgi:hypothetical protein